MLINGFLSPPQAIQAAHDSVAQEGQCRVNTNANTGLSQAAPPPHPLCVLWTVYRNHLLQCRDHQVLSNKAR